MQEQFNKIIKKHEYSLKKDDVRFSVVGYTKLFIVLLLGISIYFAFTKGLPINFILICAAELTALGALWIYHIKLNEAINCSNGIIAVNKRHLDRISGNWTSFADIGEEFIDREHAYAWDLDVIGKKSLFQFLNTTHTWYGRQTFANSLLCLAYTGDELQKRQEAVLELSKDIDFSTRLEYSFSKIGVDSSTQKLIDELKDRKMLIKSKVIKFILTYIPLAAFICAAAMSVFQQKNLYLIGAALLLIQTTAWIIGMTKTQKYLSAINRLPYKLSAYSDVIEVIKNRKFVSEKLLQIQAQLGTSNLSAVQAIKELDKISDKVSVRHSGIIYFILNVVLLWDYKCAFMFEKWKAKYAHLSESWFLALGEFESLLCFSNLANICNNTCLPIIDAQSKKIEAMEIGHPLLSNENRINNNIVCGNNIFIISGSNMSGKTTFLRTAGINLVLAQTGGFVCAKQMTFYPLKIITSMRVIDDLNEGISTFYAELKRIKTVIELAKKERNMVFLIDEIFKGTNSIDRLKGARTVISKLNELNAIGIITTHDLELCELANQFVRIKNYSFSEYYKDKKIYFDYKIKSGKSSTTNAEYLMEMLGIP